MPTLTRLGRFITANGVRIATIARESGYSRQHIARLRVGEGDPTRLAMVQITKACRRILERPVRVQDLFDLGDDDALDANVYEWLRGAQWLKRLREAVRTSARLQSDIAYKAGIPGETLSRIMTGQTRNPSMETIAAIASAVGVTVGWLLDEPGYSISAEQLQRLKDASAVIDELTGGAHA